MNCGSCGPMDSSTKDTEKHPCYSAGARHEYARMHLPVAPRCNISCNYCNRKFDCVNESRPGVTSEVLSPEKALDKFLMVKQAIPNLSVVGIAGPGDALANWENTRKTMELIREADAEVIFCLSTNGLMLPDYADEILALGVKHITVTVNSIIPEIGARIYKNVNYRGQVFRGVEGAALLLQKQLEGIEYLAQHGALVKVNIVMVKGINDNHIPAVVRKVKDLGAFITNIMPLIPAPGSAFAHFPQTSMKEVNKMREACSIDLRQMYHCQQCRADAIGLLHQDRSLEFSSQPGCGSQCGTEDSGNTAGPDHGQQFRVAVTSKYGLLVDQHFGHASQFQIYLGDGENFTLVEKRQLDKYCAGEEECDERDDQREKIVDALRDCDAVLTMRIGYHARERLLKKGILPVESCEAVENGLRDAVCALGEHNRGIA